MAEGFAKLILFSILFSILACASNDPAQEEQAYNHYKLGVTLLSKNQREQALEHLLIAKRMDPDNAKILNHLGLAYFFLNEYEHAIVELRNAIDLDENYSEAHNNLGRVFIETKNFPAARKHLNTAALDLTYPHKDKVWLNMGLTYFSENRFKKSENYFLKSISMNRKNCLAYTYYGRSQIEQEHFKSAAKALDQAIYHCRKRGYDEPHYYSAISWFRLGHKSKAIARLQEGKTKFPKGANRKKIDEMINLMKITDTN